MKLELTRAADMLEKTFPVPPLKRYRLLNQNAACAAICCGSNSEGGGALL